MSEHDFSRIDPRRGRWLGVIGACLITLASVGSLLLLGVFWGHVFGN